MSVDTVVCICGAVVRRSLAKFKAVNGREFWLGIFAKHARPNGSDCTQPAEAKGGAA